jgi:seryl-tRNA synthetase
MHDIKAIRENPAEFDKGLKRRGLDEAVSPGLLKLDEERRSVITNLQTLQEKRNALSKQVGAFKAKKDDASAEKLMAEVNLIKSAMATAENLQQQLEAKLDEFLAQIPNIPADDVPEGTDEADNVEHHKIGTPRKFNFTVKQHFEIGEALELMDFETAAKISGARFVVLKGALAKLERALGQFMLDLHTKEHGYTEVNPPLLVHDDAMFGTAQLPKFEEDQFRAGNNFWLIPTSEVPLTNLVRESIVPEKDLPLRYTAFTPCFRAEAGAAGKDTRGMIRQHQFMKVELVSITTPEQSEKEHEHMLRSAEEVLKRLELPFRTVTLCTGDMGFAARKTYDIEVWLPGQGAYREISSCSNCGDFQARRMKARYKTTDGKGPFLLHTLNGSGVAVGRCLVAILENYQNRDGSVSIPKALQPYMGGKERIANGE